MPAETHVGRGPLDADAVFELVRDCVADVLAVDPAAVGRATRFVEDLDLDSLTAIDLVEAVEQEVGERTVGFHVDDEDLAELRTVGDAVDYVVAGVRGVRGGGGVGAGG